MRLLLERCAVLGCVVGLAGGLAAEDVRDDMALAPVEVSTPSVVPIVVTTAAVIGIPVAVPVPIDRSQDIVEWKKLKGTVRSVDRANLILTVQDRDGKDIRVAYNNNIRIYRRGEQVNYSDVEPNDAVELRYSTDHKKN